MQTLNDLAGTPLIDPVTVWINDFSDAGLPVWWEECTVCPDGDNGRWGSLLGVGCGGRRGMTFDTVFILAFFFQPAMRLQRIISDKGAPSHDNDRVDVFLVNISTVLCQ